ncbi:MAG TPA: hypothetical protein VIY73_08200, partial [Polyangiaceae bacterium]
MTRAAGPSRPTRTPTARDVAARVLVRVAKDAAFAAASLDAELARHVQLDARDRALATERGNVREHALKDIWERSAPVGFTRAR